MRIELTGTWRIPWTSTTSSTSDLLIPYVSGVSRIFTIDDGLGLNIQRLEGCGSPRRFDGPQPVGHVRICLSRAASAHMYG